MKIILIGCTGFIGSHLTKELAAEGNELTLLTRRADHPGLSGLAGPPGVRYAVWNGRDAASIVRQIDGADAVVNLAGASIANGRWTEARKKILVGSRVGSTDAIVEAMSRANSKPKVLVNASAVGYYGNVDEGDVGETHPAGTGFLAELCVAWERAAAKAGALGVRVVTPRIGFVVGGKGSALGKMALPFRMFVGGPIGTGRQWLPWVDISDVTGIIRYALVDERLAGPVNAVAPTPVRMREFSAELGSAMHRPSWAPVPGFAVRLLLGELADMILGGQKAVPSVLRRMGYEFKKPDLAGALREAIEKL